MAEINADAETVIKIMGEKISRLEQENSVLAARLLTAGKMLDDAAEAEPPVGPGEPVAKAKAKR